jgi:potassium-transporting ATPase KdpC subunit
MKMQVTSATPAPLAPAASFPVLLRTAWGLLALLTLVTGVLYPLLVTGVARMVFADEADGSLVVEQGKVIGSRLIGQAFHDPEYFWSRVSATAPAGYNAAASSGSNLGPTNPALTNAAGARIEALRAADPGNEGPIPVDLVTASASGLDPHISPASALYQVSRVARARHLDEPLVRKLVLEGVESRWLGVLGEPRVNVLLLNLALDRLK